MTLTTILISFRSVFRNGIDAIAGPALSLFASVAMIDFMVNLLTKLDESTCPGAALSVLVQHNLPVAYTAAGQCVPDDIDLADARYLAGMLELPRRGATSTSSDEGHHAFG